MLTLLSKLSGPKVLPRTNLEWVLQKSLHRKDDTFRSLHSHKFRAKRVFSRFTVALSFRKREKKTKQGRCKHTNGKPPSVACFSWWKMRKEKTNKPTGWHLEIVCMQKFSVTFARKQLPHAAFSFFLGIFQVGIQKLVICSADTTKWKFVQRNKHPTEKRENTQTSCNWSYYGKEPNLPRGKRYLHVIEWHFCYIMIACSGGVREVTDWKIILLVGTFVCADYNFLKL